MLVLEIILFIAITLISLASVEFLMIIIDGGLLGNMYGKPFWWVKHIVVLAISLIINILLAIVGFM